MEKKNLLNILPGPTHDPRRGGGRTRSGRAVQRGEDARVRQEIPEVPDGRLPRRHAVVLQAAEDRVQAQRRHTEVIYHIF